MRDLLEVINQGWVGSLIGLFGLIGLIISFFIYRASRINPRPVYQCQVLRLIGRKEQALPKEVKVLFRDKNIQRLTKNYIILWNAGKYTINGENIVVDDPLRLHLSSNSEFLSAHVINYTRKQNKFTVNINPHSSNELFFRFDYLEEGDGAVLELYHTAEERRPSVRGSIRGIPKGFLNWGPILPTRTQDYPFPFRNRKLMIYIALFFGLVLFAIGFFMPLIPESLTDAKSPGARWSVMIFGLIYTALPLLLLWITRRRFPKSLLTEDIE